MVKTKRERWHNNFSEWFDWILDRAEIYDYGRYPVKGMGVWMPYGFQIRRRVTDLLRKLLDETGHEEVLFPLLIPDWMLAKESEHVRGFEDEVYWVTHGGLEELDQKLALRPTSETPITYYESLWVQSYKQLPRKFYQIVSVFRYETKATRPMIRLREAIDSKEIDTEQPTIPPEKLSRILLRRRDLLEALKYVQPTVLREVIVEVPEVHWDDIGGYEKVKQELREMVEWPLKYPKYFEELGTEPPKGILLYGPPGTGKTLLAKAVATESQSNFIAVRGPEVLSKWFGESEKAIREIFKKARMAAPCVVFFDEIDSIAPSRGSRFDSGATDRIVNQLLAEMDGIAPLKNVVVIAATNRPDILDPALLRPGRFDRLVYVPPPDESARFEILKVHVRKLKLADEIKQNDFAYLKELANRTEGYTGADLAALVREASMLALRETIEQKLEHAKPVERKHFEEALKIVKPSLTRADIERYERMAEEIKRTIR